MPLINVENDAPLVVAQSSTWWNKTKHKKGLVAKGKKIKAHCLSHMWVLEMLDSNESMSPVFSHRHRTCRIFIAILLVKYFGESEAQRIL